MVCFAFVLAACLPVPDIQETQSPIPSETITRTPTITETIVWFPPTPTFTPFATRVVQPTPDMRPALGSLLLEDDFLDSSTWQVSRSAVGSAAYGKGEFTLAVTGEQGMVLSLRPTPVFSDFYLEIDAYPTLCRSADAYGLMLRSESRENYYRLWFNCSGEIRVERIRDSRMTPLQDWTGSGLLAPGALVKTRLGVWALRDEFRVFINDEYQLSFRDPLFRSGAIGLLARAAGATPVTVSFSNLAVRAIDTDRLPTPSPVPTLTQPALPTRLPTATSSP